MGCTRERVEDVEQIRSIAVDYYQKLLGTSNQVFDNSKAAIIQFDGFSEGFIRLLGRLWEMRLFVLFNPSLLRVKEVNSTILTLAPKKLHPATMSAFRPSCCHVIYKCITKILADRLLVGLDGIISPHQIAFIPNRCIAGNVLLAQEVVKNYHKRGGKPRCTIKVDLMNTYEYRNL